MTEPWIIGSLDSRINGENQTALLWSRLRCAQKICVNRRNLRKKPFLSRHSQTKADAPSAPLREAFGFPIQIIKNIETNQAHKLF